MKSVLRISNTPVKPTARKTLSVASLLAALGLGHHEPVERVHIAPPTKAQVQARLVAQRQSQQQEGNARRFASWQRSCEQAYEAKIRKGQPAGIPHWWLKQNGHV